MMCVLSDLLSGCIYKVKPAGAGLISYTDEMFRCSGIWESGLQLQVGVMDFVPGEPVLVEGFHKGIGVEFLHVKDAWLFP